LLVELSAQYIDIYALPFDFSKANDYVRDVGKRAQLELFRKAVKKRNAKRRGRKPAPERCGFVPHVRRPEHDARHPVHVSMRRVACGPSFRSQRVQNAIVEQLRLVKQRVHVVHYSIQTNHLHLMVEGHDRADLARQMKVLFSRIAFAVNRVALRAGKLFADRHHRHELRTPTEVRRALVYILFNDRKHDAPARAAATPCDVVDTTLDFASSAIWMNDWDPRTGPRLDTLERQRAAHDESPVSPPETWLARAGWRRAGGPLRADESPATRG